HEDVEVIWIGSDREAGKNDGEQLPAVPSFPQLVDSEVPSCPQMVDGQSKEELSKEAEVKEQGGATISRRAKDLCGATLVAVGVECANRVSGLLDADNDGQMQQVIEQAPEAAAFVGVPAQEANEDEKYKHEDDYDRCEVQLRAHHDLEAAVKVKASALTADVDDCVAEAVQGSGHFDEVPDVGGSAMGATRAELIEQIRAMPRRDGLLDTSSTEKLHAILTFRSLRRDNAHLQELGGGP
ncbi:unnamed protein product, partial [Prorocentrum cordatum]